MTLPDAERCEAAYHDGRRCTNRWVQGVAEYGAHLPYRVCGRHLLMGRAALARGGQLPQWWHDNWKRWR